MRTPDDDNRPLCVGQHELFDSTNPLAHEEAATLCALCPLIEWCDQRYKQVHLETATVMNGGPQGTWAGKLYAIAEERTTVQCGTVHGARKHRRHQQRVCDACKEAESKTRGARVQARRDQGLCIDCGQTPEGNYRLCKPCRVRAAESRAKHREGAA